MLTPPFRIGVDVGGTFTDLVLVDATGSVRAFKAPSVPGNPTEGVLAAVKLAADAVGRDMAGLLHDTGLFVHGSTIATNTLLEKKGAAVGLLTTRGFRDSLEIRRGLREDVWDHRTPFPPVLVPRYLRLPVTERIGPDGAVLTPLDPASIAEAAAVFAEEKVEAVAVALLHAYRNPEHERAVKALVEQALPGIWVTCSSEVAPVIGEYERTSTAVVNAYVAPRVVPYLRALDERLTALGLPNGLLLVQSNGGAISVAEIGHTPVQLILSGPAAGIGSLRFFGRDTGSSNLVAIEVGGTSCDVTLMQDGAVGMTDQLVVDGYHLAIPAVEIHTVGAGGGTIARVDDAGLLHAGPQGAGARPGPAAYGLGGDRPTVTDAQLVLGRLKAGPYAGGAISLDLDKATAAVRTHVAEPLGIPLADAAAGIIKLVEQNILHAVERVSIERGYNPRHFTLVAAGGAGPLHGAPVARALGCAGLYVPRLAGVFCAFGMCNADIRHDYLRSWLHDLDDPAASGRYAIDAAFAELEAAAAAVLAREGFGAGAATYVRGYDLRYVGQQWTVAVDCESSEAAAVRAAFETVYRRLYGYVQPAGQIEIVNLRLAGIGRLPPLTLEPPAGSADAPVAIGHRAVWIDETTGFADVAIYDGTALLPGQALAGPAIVEEATTTILVGAGDRLTVTGADNYLVTLAREGTA
ncbi:MAG: hydantoinase/oxoprolinase family protein [Alphaproteobacteria bacterium]